MSIINHLILSLLLVAALFLVSCDGGKSIADKVADAELAMSEEDVASTRSIADDILSHRPNNGGISATELARLSILYMQINERTDDSESVELAADCYREAFEANADSAAAFYHNLPVDQLKYAMVLASIVHSADKPDGIDGYPDESLEYTDSILPAQE